MRKYDKKNKTNIGVVLGICALVIIVFSLFILRVREMDKKIWQIDANSILFDDDKNMINTSGTATIKAKWSGNYYLSYENEDYKLSKNAVVYNNAIKSLTIYGNAYKINEDESVEVLSDETKLEDTMKSRFYKLGDRKYLLVSSDIDSVNGSFHADNYLMVELDKVGNAVLYNNKINVKTFKETTLKTDAYTFDIANEILTYGEIDIDLKKIIGSTNQYKPQPSTTKKGNTVPITTETTTTTTVVDSDSGSGNGSGSGEGGNGTGHNSSITDDRVYQDKNFSIVRTVISTSSLSFDYSIYDPKSEYKNVFVEIENDDTKDVESYYLAKNANSLDINGLLPNTKYNVAFKYSYIADDGSTEYDVFNIDFSIKTLLPDINIAVLKVVKNNVYYTITSSDIMYGLDASFYINNSDEASTEKSFESENGSNVFSGTFDISEYEGVNYVDIRVSRILYKSGSTNVNLHIRVKL